MKKLSKVVLAASMFAALFAGCSNGLVANDTLDKADVEGYATEDGVIILEWDDVKDADVGYTIYVKTPFTERYSIVEDGYSTEISTETDGNGGSVTTINNNFFRIGGIQRFVYSGAVEADADYEFKIVAHTSKPNLLDSESEITVTTPEALKDTSVCAAGDIKLTLKAGTLNMYEVSMPVSAGYNYRIVSTTDIVSDAKDAYALNAPKDDDSNDWSASWNDGNASWYDGASYIAVTKENSDGDDYVVDAVVDTIQIDADGKDHYIIVKAMPKNDKVATVKYVVSSASVNPSYTGDVWAYNFDRTYVTNTSTGVTSFAGVEFFANKYNYTEKGSANLFTVYRKTVKDTYKINALNTLQKLKTGSTVTWENLGNPVEDTDYSTDYTQDVKYKLACTEAKDAEDGTVDYTHTYYVSWKSGDNRVFSEAF